MLKSAARLLAPLAIILSASLLAVGVGRIPLFETLEHKTVDGRIRFRVPQEAFGGDVVVVLLDEGAMETLPYRSPVPRDMLARLVGIVDAAGARLIALDVFLKNTTWAQEDDALADAMKASGRVVLVSAIRDENGGLRHDLPLPLFLDAALAVGLADFPVDPFDQRIRQLQAVYTVGDQRIPALSAALYALVTGKAAAPSGETAWPRVAPGDLPLKLDSRHRAFIDYQAPPSTAGGEKKQIATYAASAVLTGFLPAAWFAGKVVLIGAGYADNTDAYRTPFYSSRTHYALTPGVEIHANALATLFNGKTLRFLPAIHTWLLTLLFGLVLMVVELRFNTLVAGTFLLATVSAYTAAAFAVFENTDLALPLVPVMLAMLAAFVLLAVYRTLTEGRQKRFIKNAFQMYLSPEFVNALVKQPDLLLLGGVEKELTILFSDLQGFTSLSEGMDPTGLVRLLNEYLDGMTRILLAHGGTLDKYEGDAIMAFWGAPLDQPDHAVRAVRAALEMARFSDELSRRFQARGNPPIKTRIGLNTGTAVVGNIGSERRFNYTIIGDEVNLASRLEGANKQYGTYLMISQSTRERVADHFVCRQLDLIRVKGKKKPVGVHEVMGFAGEAFETGRREMLQCYEDGLSAYQRRDWQTAVGMFEAALDRVPDDGPSLTYRKRCRHFLDNPPEADWDGVYIMTTK